MADVFPMTGVEARYPVVPLHLVDKVINITDSREVGRTVLAADKVHNILRFLVDIDNISALISFIEAHLLVVVDLTTAGMHPFGSSFTRSEVNILRYDNLSLIGERTWSLDVTFEFVTGLS
jgi:hypothetical protein